MYASPVAEKPSLDNIFEYGLAGCSQRASDLRMETEAKLEAYWQSKTYTNNAARNCWCKFVCYVAKELAATRFMFDWWNVFSKNEIADLTTRYTERFENLMREKHSTG